MGPPGTGKTTTLIRRLGQKLDPEFLEEEERGLVELVGSSTALSHSQSWVMFTPTELLKQFVKEAFARENVPASNERIRTWDDYRHYLARSVFGVLKSGTGRGLYVQNSSDQMLLSSAIENQIDWFEEFKQYSKESVSKTFNEAVTWLLENSNDNVLHDLLKRIQAAGVSNSYEINSHVIAGIEKITSDLNEFIDNLKKDQEDILKKKLNLILREDKSFLTNLSGFIESIEKEGAYEVDTEDDEEEIEVEQATGQSQNKLKKAYNEYALAIRSLARAKRSNRKLSKKSKSSQVVAWLGGGVVGDTELELLGENLEIQKYLRRLSRPIRVYTTDIPKYYRTFRRECLKENKWYNAEMFSHRTNAIHELEVDVILLTMLHNINDLASRYTDVELAGNQKFSVLRSIVAEHRNQVLVDEVTDFSPIQLACMLALTPNLNSFFACGDFNQRITNCGTRTPEQFSWLGKDIETREISISYRQSRQLNELANRITVEKVGGVTELPENIDNEGVSPVLLEGVAKQESLYTWLKERIIEIESTVEALPSIAIFVDNEDEVQSVANTLQEYLAESNIRVAGCSDGKVMGQDGDIRVFNIKHIKGLEFEAVFFLGVDKLALNLPNLFEKYLYVGLTRAATYLGLVCDTVLPDKLEPVRELFIGNWQ